MKYIYTLLGLLMLVQAQATVRRVRAGNTSPGNGLSWSLAYNDLQAAINTSSSGDEVWVAVPIGSAKYQPASGFPYNMKEGVKIYGGFAGTETILSSRNWQANITTLQGNANTVVSCNSGLSSSSLLDGFTITGGNNYFGGGINSNDASATFSNLIISNNYASNSGGGFYTFGSPTLTNVVFTHNTCGTNGTYDENGGGLYIDQGYPIVTNCIFDYNYAHRDGGAVYAYEVSYTSTRKPTFINCLFNNNESGAGAGGAVFGLATSFIFTNCTFYGNTCYVAGCGAGIHNYGNSSSGAVSNTVIKNCLFWSNFVSFNGVQSDLYNSPSYATATTTYSVLVGPQSGTGNVAPSGTIPFVNPASPAGPDNLWFTADDGYRLIFCNPIVIDKGDNSAISATTDLGGNPRKFDVPLVADAGAGTSPIVDLGAYENQTGATAIQLTGSIGNAHIIPYPQELTSDSVSNVQAPASGMSVRWERNINGSWEDASPSSTLNYYKFPVLMATTQFRRVVYSAAYCNTPYYSNVVQIKVANPTATQAGGITGKVSSPNGTGVQGIQIRVTRQVAISGSPAGYTYLNTTDGAGEFSITPVYYGDLDISSSSATFTVTPVKVNDRFNPASLSKTVSYYTPKPTSATFTDTTVLSITGRTYQECSTCLNLAGNTTLISCPIDSINIFKNNSYATATRNINGVFGQYGITVSDPVLVTIEPRFTGHTFTPSSLPVTPVNNVSGVDFKDLATHTISGRLTAGCGELIGTSTLEFGDSLPPDASGNIRMQACFRKRVTTDVNGNYAITLPARPYKVKVIGFTPLSGATNPIQATELLFFINNKLPADSLYRDITTHDTTLNLVYERPPVIAIVEGLTLQTCPNPLGSFSILQQAVTDSLRIKVFRGQPASYTTGCALSDSINKVILATNVSSQSMANDSASFKPTATGVLVRLRGGSPNVAGNHFKSLALYYTDKYGRSASLLRTNILVTGALQDQGANFFTVSPPPVPLLVLHDPPGDGSYSYWQNTKSTQTAFRMYASSASDQGGWLEVKLGTKLETGIFVSTESEVWATANGTTTKGKTNTSATEQVYTNTYTSTLNTSSTTSEVGSDGDVYVGMALNLIYTSATEISYNACQIKDTTTMIFAPGGVPTEFHSSEKQIKTVTIPSLLNAAAVQPTQYKKDSVMNIARQWQQMIDNNNTNKQNAVSTNQNITFNGGGSGTGSSFTTTVSKSNTTEFSMNIDMGLAIAAGFEIAGSGVSGGAIVNFKTETGGSTVTDSTTETTVGYVLTDANSGDQFTVNIKKDQQSGTPVFQLLAGQSSCPPEEGTQLRDQIQLANPNPIATDTNQVGTLEYKLYLGNISAITTDPSRPYNLYVDASSNSDGATVVINGVSNPTPSNPASVTVPRRSQQLITVRVTKVPTSPVFSYTGLSIIAVDPCSGDITDTALLSAYFISSCSSVKLDEPANNWILADNNYLKTIVIKGYDRTSLSTINLQYAAAGSSNWIDANPIFTPATLNANPSLGTSFNWNTAGLSDGNYNIRLKLVCSQGITYSEVVTGIIDHAAPALLGKPSPSDDIYVNGDVISYTYNEDIAVNNINTSNVTLTRLMNGVATPINITVTGYKNSLVVIPVSSINSFVGSTMRVIVKDIVDIYGNKKLTPDTSYFLVGTTIVATGTNAMKVAIAKPKVSKNSDSTIDISFKLPVTSSDSLRVNYTVGGTARLGIDYTIQYVGYQPTYTYNNGTQGAIRLPKSSNQVTFQILPLSDTALTPDKTVTISLSEGGDYALGDTTTRTGVITSDDGITTYTFVGTGNFSDKINWLNGKKPLTTLVAGKTIFINPSGTCTLDVPLTIRPGATLRVMQNRSFIIPGNLKLN